MALEVFEKVLEKVHKKIDALSFCDLIRKSRDALGIKQYRAAEFVGVSQQRIKNLETGFFRGMPSTPELHALGVLYDIKFSILKKKAVQHVHECVRDRKVRVIRDEI